MLIKAKFAAYAFATTIALGSLVQAANATCGASMQGTWQLYAVEDQPGGGGNVTKCVATVASNGNFTAPCTSFSTGSGGGHTHNVSGTLTLSGACDLTGSITIPGNAKITIPFGHVNGNIGAGIGTQGLTTNTQVLHFDLVRQ